MELYRLQLREKLEKASETLPELGQNISRLTNLAFPTVPANVRETLAKDCFVDSLASSDLRLIIKQARPLNSDDAVRHAVELEAYFKAESNRMDASSYVNSFDTGEQQSASSCTDVQKLVNALATLQKSVEKIEDEMNSMKLEYSSPRGVRLKCYYAFFLVCCDCDNFYIVSAHIQCQASIHRLSLCGGHSWWMRLAKQETLTPPGHLVSPLVGRGP